MKEIRMTTNQKMDGGTIERWDDENFPSSFAISRPLFVHVFRTSSWSFNQVFAVGLLIGMFIILSLNSKACCASDLMQRSHVSTLAFFQFTQDGRFLVTAASDGELLLWDSASGECLRELLPVREWPGKADAKFSLHEAKILIYDNDGASNTIQLLDLKTGRLLQSLVIPEQVRLKHQPQFSQEGRYIFATAWKRQWQGWICWDSETGEQILGPDQQHPELENQVAELMKQFNLEGASTSSPQKPEVASEIVENLLILKQALAERGTLASGNVMGGYSIGIRFSPNGRIAVCNYWGDTGCSEENVSVWDFDSCQLLYSFDEPYSYRNHVLFSSDGERFLIGHTRDKLQVRSCKTGKLIRELAHTGGKISAMVLSPKDPWIATGGTEGAINVWNANEGTLLHQFSAEGKVASIEFSPNGQYLVVARKGHPAVVYSTEIWKPVCKVADAVEVTQFSPDSRRLFVANERGHPGMARAGLFAVPSGKKISTIAEPPSYTDLTISPSSDWCLGVPITPRNGKRLPLSVWNARTGELLHQFAPNEFLLEHPRYWSQNSVKFRGLIQSTPVRSAATLKSQAIWGRRAFRPLRYEPHLRPETEKTIPQIRDLNPRGRQWLEGMLIEKAADPSTAKQPRLFRTNTDGTLRFIQWGFRGHIAIRDETGNSIRKFLEPGMVPKAATLSSDGRQIWVGYRSSKYKDRTQRLVEWEIETGKRIREIDATPAVYAGRWDIRQMMLSPNDRYLAAGNKIYDLQNQTQDVVATPVQFSPDSKSVFCFGHDRTLWSLEKRKELTVFGSHNTVNSPVFSSDGRYLLVQRTMGRGTTLWDAHTSEAVQEFCQELKFAFSPVGDRFVSWSSSSYVASHLWSFENGRMLADLSTELGPGCLGVCFSPDGKLLMTWHRVPPPRHQKVSSHRVAFWNAKTGKKIRVRSGSLLIHNLESQPFFVDNTRCITIHQDGAKLWDAQQGNRLHYYTADPHVHTRVVLSPDKLKLLVITPGKCGVLWDVASGKKEQQFERLRGRVKFTNDQKLFIEHCRSRQLVKIWDVTSGQLLRQMHSPEGGSNLVIK